MRSESSTPYASYKRSGLRKPRASAVGLTTRFAADVNSEKPHPEYPRPGMVRPNWHSLNGPWQVQQGYEGDEPPIGGKLSRTIVVPFPVESALSGVKQSWEHIWYKRCFSLPDGWSERNVILHFGAVDWQADVYLNGRKVGSHKGGYDPFSFDVTSYLNPSSNNELMVRVTDPTDRVAIANGKQVRNRFENPNSMWYTPCSGIWQSVWIENVPRQHITDLKIVSDIDAGLVRVGTVFAGKTSGYQKRIAVVDHGQAISEWQGDCNTEAEVPLPGFKTWSPDSPYLYDLRVELLNDLGAVVDQVESYFGMRKISIENGPEGVPRIFLNNKPYFNMAVLDQGYWPDGVYTAPTDAALRSDIEAIKELGFNTARKHMKIEPERWYYWADKLGILVWQDMPSPASVDEDSEFKVAKRDHLSKFPGAFSQWKQELERMIQTHRNHPSIVLWVCFNEQWGLVDEKMQLEVAKLAKRIDPTRLVTANSAAGVGEHGGHSHGGDVNDWHNYPEPKINRNIASPHQAHVNGEYGGYIFVEAGHQSSVPKDLNWVSKVATKEILVEKYLGGIADVIEIKRQGASGAVYTQLTDVLSEANGLLTFDRQVNKMSGSIAKVRQANRSTYV